MLYNYDSADKYQPINKIKKKYNNWYQPSPEQHQHTTTNHESELDKS